MKNYILVLIAISLDLVDMTTLPADSTVYVPGKHIQKILYGIDIGTAELLYAKQNNFDCVIAHHPVGNVDSFKEFSRHLIQLQSKGVPLDEAKQIVHSKMESLKFTFHSRNYDAVPSFARLLNIPFLNIHCPSDELGRSLVTNSIEELDVTSSQPTLKDLQVHLLKTFPEFRNAETKIEIALGDENTLLGNWIFSHGALTNGGFSIANAYFKYQVNTVIYIHIAPTELSRFKQTDSGNLVIIGHPVSDSIGINPLLNELEVQRCEITSMGD